MYNISNIIDNILVMVLWPVFLGASVIMFIWAGFLFLTAQGDPGKITQAKKAVIWAVVGIVVALVAFSAERIIRTILGV